MATSGGFERVVNFPSFVLEFLEAVVHEVLFVRKIYQPATFCERRLYDTIVHKSRHPGVVEYISSVVSSLKACIQSGRLRSFNVVFFDDQKSVVAKTVLEFKTLNLKQLKLDDIMELEAVFRNSLRNITVSNTSLTPLPKDATFEVIVCTKKGGSLELDMWCEEVATDVDLVQSPVKCTPIKSIDLGVALRLNIAAIEK